MEGREAQAQRLRERAGIRQGSYWDGCAEGFQRATQSRVGETDPLHLACRRKACMKRESEVGPRTTVS